VFLVSLLRLRLGKTSGPSRPQCGIQLLNNKFRGLSPSGWFASLLFDQGVLKKLLTSASSSRSERHLTVFCIDQIVPGFAVYCPNGGKKLSKHTRVLGSTASIPLSLLKPPHLKGVDVIYERPWSWTSLGLELSHELQCDDVDQIKVQIVLPPRRTCVDRINGIPTCSFSLAHPDRIVQIRVHSRFEFQIGHSN
jgi:hypothetical protein